MLTQEQNLKQLLAEGAAHHKNKNFSEAEMCFTRFLESVPDEPRLMNYLGMVLSDQGKLDQAIEVFKQAAALDPGNPDTYNNLGRAYKQKQLFNEARDAFARAVSINSNHFIYQYNYANSFFHFGQLAEAEKYYRKAIELNPGFPQSYVNLAITIVKQSRFDEAEQACLKAISLTPDYELAYESLGEIYEYQYKFLKMIETYEALLKINPNHHGAIGQLVMLYQYMCQWDKWEIFRQKADKANDELIAQRKPAATKPFVSLMYCDDEQVNLAVARSHADKIADEAAAENLEFSFAGRQKQKDKIVVGYISADIRNHALGNNVQHLFAAHDRNNVVVHVYATNEDDGGEVRKVIEKGCDEFFDCHGSSEPEIANLIYDNKVDILVDLTGHMSGGRLKVSALRPAPIQVAMWGYPGTTGTNFQDYIIADKIIIPEEHQSFYTGKCVYLPGTVEATSPDRNSIEGESPCKKDFGLPENAFVFNAHHSSYKIDPVIFDLWLRLLKQVDNSVIWLRDCGELPKQNLIRYASQSGIEATRLFFSDKIVRDKYFKRLSVMDLGLDTLVYNGGSTTMDCLWAGLPVISLLGNHYPSRMSASIINGVGLYDDLVVTSLEEYEEKALELATHPDKLKSLKDKLWQSRSSARLFDINHCADDLEKAYKEMWRTYAGGLSSKTIDLT